MKTSGHTALGASLLSAEWVTDCIYMLASQQQEYGDRSGYTRQRIICESWIKHAYLSIAAAADILCTHSDMPVNGIYLGHLFSN